jgi:hypothetical protein
VVWHYFAERKFRPDKKDDSYDILTTGDGKADLIAVIHDRIIIYPQD